MKKPAPQSRWVGFSEIVCVYINLDERKDRKSEVEAELAKVKIESPNRQVGIKRTPGILGCTLSHASALDSVRDEEGIVMICEDDVEFLGDPSEIEPVVEEFSQNPLLDVLCLAYNLGAKPHRISDSLAITSDTQTASCYLVKPHAIDPLVRIFNRGASMLEKGAPAWAAANDVIWKRLQRGRLVFAIPHKPLARQRPSFSDVEGKWVDYGV